jgi:translation initiation factor IF-2
VGTPTTVGRIKVLEDFQGKTISQALPSQPVVILGFEKPPKIGEELKGFQTLEQARSLVLKERKEQRQGAFIAPGKQILNLIIKADVLGSLEAIEKILQDIPQENVVLRLLRREVGEINESDIKLAKAGKAVIFGFRTKTDMVAQRMAARERIRIKHFEVIYELSQYLREQMEKMLKPKLERLELGKLKTLLVFLSEKNRQIVGGKIIEGGVKKGAKIEVFRAEEKIGDGKIINLQKNKKDITEAKKGEEVGILYEGNVKIQERDILSFYTQEWQKGEL